MSVGLVVGVLGWLLWWGGYYVALGTAWRAGVRGVGTVIALGLGICGCSGIPILAIHFTRVQTAAFEAIGRGGDEVLAGRRLRTYQIAMFIAVLGMVMQIVGGYMLPDDDGSDGLYGEYDDGGYRDSYDSAYDDGADEAGDIARDEVATDEIATGELGPGDMGAEVSPEIAGSADTLDPVIDALGAEEMAIPEPPPPSTSRLLVLGLSPDGRAAIVLAEGDTRGRVVTRARRARFAVRPGATIAIEGTDGSDVLVASAVEDLGAAPWEGLPRPEVLRATEASDLSALALRWVLIGGATGIDATSVAITDTLALRVRAPRGAIVAGTVYMALRGVLVDTSAYDRRGGIELWISREEDVIAPQ